MKKYTVIDRCVPTFIKKFNTKKETEDWLLKGMFGTEGSEKEHWVGMFHQFKEGKKTLDYNGEYTH